MAFAYASDCSRAAARNLYIKPGQMVGIVGATGGGKSTIVSLIPRFYDPTAGKVKIDGVDIRQYKLQAFAIRSVTCCRRPCSSGERSGTTSPTAGPEPRTTKSSKPQNSPTRMSLSRACLNGYDTLVGDRGETLSGGQRQRIGIARAIIRNNPILILDEPTAALDTESERAVIEALDRLMRGRTVITIAHRLSTIRNCDKILVLKDGVVAEEGTHDELLALGGVYADLYRAQFEASPVKADS